MVVFKELTSQSGWPPFLVHKVRCLKMDVPQGDRHLLQRRHLDNGLAANGVARMLADGADVCPEGFVLARGIAGPASFDTLLESPNEVLQRQAERLANAAKSRTSAAVRPTLLAHKGLGLPEPPGQVHLAKPGFGADVPQEGLQLGLVVERILHRHAANIAALTYIPKSDMIRRAWAELGVKRPNRCCPRTPNHPKDARHGAATSAFRGNGQAERETIQPATAKWIGNKQRFAHESSHTFRQSSTPTTNHFWEAGPFWGR